LVVVEQEHQLLEQLLLKELDLLYLVLELHLQLLAVEKVEVDLLDLMVVLVGLVALGVFQMVLEVQELDLE
jgi:hypothetical protein